MLQISEIDYQLETETQKPSHLAHIDQRVGSTLKDVIKTTLKEDNEPLQLYDMVKLSKQSKRSPGTTIIHSMENKDKEGKRAITFEV